MMESDLLARPFDEHGPALVLYARQWSAAPEGVVQEAMIQLRGHRRPPLKIVFTPPGYFRKVIEEIMPDLPAVENDCVTLTLSMENGRLPKLLSLALPK